MAMFEMTPEKQDEWARRYREAVKDQVQGEVEAVGPFQRQGQWFMTIPVIGQLGAIVYFTYQGIMKKRAGGLPSNFLIAVTSEKVHAFKYRASYTNIKIQKEVGVWDRGDIHVAEHKSGTLADAVTLEANENGETERVKVNANMLSRNPWSAEVLELLKK
jgi:hypothetical protein